MSTNLTTASREWATRPQDERFETLEALRAVVNGRKARSDERIMTGAGAKFEGAGQDLWLLNDRKSIRLNHWAFGQMARAVGAPAGYLRSLPAELASQCLNSSLWKFDASALVETDPETNKLTARAFTSDSYGRIWDSEVVGAVQEIVERTGGRFFNPMARTKDGNKPQGLYASDRDVFMFMIDGGSLIDGGGERDQLHRGFIAWNSEVGKCTMGLQTFLFRAVCGNHIIWGAEDIKEIRIRHTSGWPQRFAMDATRELKKFTALSTESTRQGILAAKRTAIPSKPEELWQKFATRFDKTELISAVAAAEKEEGKCENIWELVQGLTAHARQNPWLDGRVDLERRAGKLLDTVSN